jgi:hypothetical protein
MIYLEEPNVFYVMPVQEFIGFRSEIHFVEKDKRQRKPRSAKFRNAWHLISHWAVHRETGVRKPVKFGEAFSMVIPSQASDDAEEGVET